MKKYLSVLLLTIAVLCGTGLNAKPKKVEGFTSADSDKAMESFQRLFYNPEMKLYSTTCDGKGRAAIWTQAIYWDMVMNAYIRTQDTRYLRLMEDVYQGAYEQYDGYNWNNTVEWFIYDDIMWWVISLARAYEITGEQHYLDLSRSGFRRVWEGGPDVPDNGSYDPEKGGMKWGWKRDEWRGKMACINYPTVIAAAILYNITGEEDYLEKAVEIYGWARNNLFSPAVGIVADSKHGDNPPHWKAHLYNQATCIGAAVELYKITGEKRYKKDAVRATDFVRHEMSDSEGLLPFENGIEQGVYAAIFAQYIIRLVEDCGRKEYLPWLRYNIDTAWGNRDRERGLTFKDFANPCPVGTIEVYDASACPALMQVVPPAGK